MNNEKIENDLTASKLLDRLIEAELTIDRLSTERDEYADALGAKKDFAEMVAPLKWHEVEGGILSETEYFRFYASNEAIAGKYWLTIRYSENDAKIVRYPIFKTQREAMEYAEDWCANIVRSLMLNCDAK